MRIADKNVTRAVLERHGFTFKKSFGQNFLTDTNILQKIVDSAEIDQNVNVIEIGPGIGALTEFLAENAAEVMAFEIDDRLIPILTEAGLTSVQTYIQCGNIICETNRPDKQLSQLIYQTIKEKIGADLAVIIKNQSELTQAVLENPFDEDYDSSHVHLVFTNDELNIEKLNALLQQDFGDEELRRDSQCLYMYLPREASKKKLNTNYLEKQLGITTTMRKLSVVSRLSEITLL